MFGTQRTGSSLFYQVIAEYLWQNHWFIGLDEYFDPGPKHYRDSGTGIECVPLDQPVWKHPPSVQRKVLEYKMNLLKKYHGRFFFRMHSIHTWGVDVDWLADRYRWIFVERRNLFEQLQSFTISMTTHRWYEKNGLGVQPGTIEATEPVIDSFIYQQSQYALMKARLKPAIVLVYEDLTSPFCPQAVLSATGFRESANYGQVEFTERQNPPDKLQLFKNPDLLIQKYRQSVLNEVSPIA